MKTKLGHLWDALRENYWLVPAALTAAATLLAFIVFALDEAAGRGEIELPNWVYRSSVEGARAILATVATSMISIAALTFSITMVTLVLASQQFGPRVLRSFLRDRGNQYVLGTFLAGFLFSLISLGLQKGAGPEEEVPRLAVTAGLTLAAAGVAVLIFFINHVAKAIQASHVLAAIATELHDAIERLLPPQSGEQESSGAEEAFDEQGSLPLLSHRSGYLQAVDVKGLVKLASENNLVLRFRVRPGDFVAKGSVLLDAVGRERLDSLEIEIQRAFVLGTERTMTQDLEFGLYQLTEVAIRALSPGINDPHTALTAVDRIGEVLAAVAARPFPSPVFRDEQGYPRVIEKPFTFEGMVRTSFDELRQYGASSAAVVIRMIEALTLIASRTRDSSRHAPLLAQVEMIARSSHEKIFERSDVEDIERRRQEFLRAIHESGERNGKGDG